MIPHQLQKLYIGFVKLRPKSKIPFEQDWQDNPYSFSDIQAWVDHGGNYGIQGGYGRLIIIDADRQEITDIVTSKFPQTFIVKTPRQGFHYYFFCDGIDKKIVFKKDTPEKKDEHFGEIIAKGSQVVGPGSIHPDTGTEYEVFNDVEIAEISREQIYSELIEYIQLDNLAKNSEPEIGNISVVDILNKKGIPLRSVGKQLVCGHPVHGSTNDDNFVVHPEKNVWHCFRCGTGGGVLSLIAVLEGIIQCNEAVAGGLRGDKFTETLRFAKDIYGIIDVKANPLIQVEPILSEDKVTAIEAKIKAIPADTAPTMIPALLDPVLKEIAGFNIAQGEAILKHTIKEHFSFTAEDLKGYEKVLKAYRKKQDVKEDDKSLSRAEIMKILQDENENKEIHPAQNYRDGIMTFAVKIKDIFYIITSDKRLFSLQDAQREGFILKHNSIDTARFSAKGISGFLEDNREVDVPGLYQKIYDYIKRFICFPEEVYMSFITLWVMGTYLFTLFRYYPYVWLNAEKASGKTLLMEVLSAIAFNGELITNPTESVIFRDISNNLITMFIDEVEQLRKRDKDVYGSLISLLNAGFNRAGVVKRSESTGQGGFVVKAYSAYSPKMFAGISEIDDVLQDRTIRIPLLRKKDDEIVQRYKETPEILELQRSIRDDLYEFALAYAEEIAQYYHMVGPDSIEALSHLNNRELDIWEPIFLLAKAVDARTGSMSLTGMMETLSKKSLEEKQSDSVSQNETYKILTILKTMLDELTPLSSDGHIKVFESERVFEYFKANEDFDWIQRTNVLTRRLRKVNIESDQRRIDGIKKRVYIVNSNIFIDLCERFKI